MQVNLWGYVRMCRAVLPLLRQSKGRIIVISSIEGEFTSPLQSLYCASKFALEGLNDSLRREVGRFGVEVILVRPGFVATDMIKQLVDELGSLVASDKVDLTENREESAHIGHTTIKQPATDSLAKTTHW
mmetsp:Transcript_45296/g.73776  ORF Transcript_45296/g.73776 Transcript_45296/m.73776 type:complete len:130 (+) Transcript_45296:373-762(+)